MITQNPSSRENARDPALDTSAIKQLGFKELNALHFDYNEPFKIELSDGKALLANEIIRIMPKKRVVVFGTWLGRPIVAKLFFHAKNAKKHISQEVEGLSKLEERRVPTPQLFCQTETDDGRVKILIFERMLYSKNLEAVLNDLKNIDDCMRVLRIVIVELATQHVLGILQKDLHLKNFLLTERSIYTLDGAQIEKFPFLLSKRISLENIALFLSQLNQLNEKQIETLFKYYARARGWLLKDEDFNELHFLIKKTNGLRWQQYAEKIQRASTQFEAIHPFGRTIIYDRQYKNSEFIALLKNPEAFFHHPSLHILKAGGSSTVGRVCIEGQYYVIKRFNLKNIWHRIRRTFRKTRANLSWRLGNKLALFNVATPKPIALIENHLFGMYGTSYYVTAYVQGMHAGEFFKSCTDEEKLNVMVKKISDLLKKLCRIEVAHGDLKITNILIDEAENPYIIDFDGAKEYVSLASLRAAWRKEIKRFMKNFESQPELSKKFIAEFD